MWSEYEKKETVLDILDLHRSGLNQRAIARKLGLSRNTVKKYIEGPEKGFAGPEKHNRQSILDPYRGMIKVWLDEDEYYTGTWIYDRLVNQGYTGSYETVKREVGKMKKQRQKIAYMRFETNPGHQAQVDFGEFQVRLPHGTSRKL
jgi:transposase